MQLINVPRCQCRAPLATVAAVNDGNSQCLSCGVRYNTEGPHIIDVPEQIVPLITGLFGIAELNVHEMRARVSSHLAGVPYTTTTVSAHSKCNDARLRLQWGMVPVPLTPDGGKLSDLQGSPIDLQKLPTATTPEMRSYLSLLARAGFVTTRIGPLDDEMVMDLHGWGAQKIVFGDTLSHEKLLVRIRVTWSRDVIFGLQDVLNTLNDDVIYANSIRPLIESSLEAGVATYQLCLTLIEKAREHAQNVLQPTQSVRQRGRSPVLSYAQQAPFRYVIQYADHYIKCIRQRIGELMNGACDEQEAARLLRSKPESLELRSPEFLKAAENHLRFIDAAYSLFSRIPAATIKMEARLAELAGATKSAP